MSDRPPWNIPDNWVSDTFGDRSIELMDVGLYTDEIALMYTWFNRWTDEWCIDCSHCGAVDEHYCIEDLDAILEFGLSWRYKCKKCSKKFSVTSGTWIANHKLPVEYWWRTAYLLGDFNIPINSSWLARDLKLTQKTTHYMLIVIAKALGISLRTPLKTSTGTDDIMKALLTVRTL